jgi:hypothetical protein
MARWTKALQTKGFRRVSRVRGKYVKLLSSQVPLTTQPPFHPFIITLLYGRIKVGSKVTCENLPITGWSAAKPRLVDFLKE